MNVEPRDEHRWLQRMVGEWTYEGEASMSPGGEVFRDTGTESVRSLGGVWVLCEGSMQVQDGTPTTTLMTLGFDPGRGRFVGTFIGSMMTHLWIYEGELDPSGNVLVLDAEGPSFEEEGKMARYKDRIEFHGDDHRVLSSSYMGGDGQWHPFMTAHYRRAG